ncbi:cell surface hyaluronidase-like isoform X2 [Branchiostoma floridae x Branchiostoma belcheri]
MAGSNFAVVLLGVLASVLSQISGCPDVDPTLTPWNPGHHPNAQVVVGRGQNYLLQSSATFSSLEVKDGGKVVFADLGQTEIVLRAREVTVGSDGEFHIGSETCPYQGRATVSLYGRKDDQKNSKQFLVTAGGTLEIHGQHKLAWTQLTQTVPAGGLPKGTFAWDSATSSRGRGMHVNVVDEISGAVVDWRSFDTHASEGNSRNLASFIDQIPQGKIVTLQTKDEASSRLEATAREKIRALGSVEVDSLSRREPWAFVGVKGDPSRAVERRIPYIDTQTTGTAAVTATFDAFFGSFDITVTSEWLGGRDRCTFSVKSAGGDYVLNLKDDVSSWQPGDHIVLASTDYNMEQAEEFRLVPCPQCSAHQVKISGEVQYNHFGEVSDDVDLRGEVGLLTRNVRFQGEVEDSCYGDNYCQFFDYDTYGGHMKILRGFRDVHLSGVEFTRMGQQVNGAYPVHFHMAGDVDEAGGYSRPAYVRELSIHHCFSRCVTIHGTNGLLVQDTVGYDTLGHCYFLEDGAEQRNVLDHNLGLMTRAGTLLPTDRDAYMCRRMRDEVYGDYVPSNSDCEAVATFWIAHPNNILINNAAAGSLFTGIWYIFHREPTGLSAGALPRYQASRTPLGRFYNNRVHSNGEDGFMIDEGVKTTQPSANSPEEYLSRTGARYKPHQNADLLQPRVPAMIEGLIAFKNIEHGAWVRGGDIWFNKCAFVDNGKGLTMSSEGTFPNDEGSSQKIWDSIFIGESENVGTASGSSDWGMGGVKPVPRSFPKSTSFPMRGLEVYDGPTLAERCTFKNYAAAPEYNRWSSAIGFFLNNNWQTAPKNNLTGIKFEEVQSRVFLGGRNLPYFQGYDKDGDKTQIFHDDDGSTTGYPDTFVVGQDNFVLRTPGCVEKPEWRAYICSGKYAQLFIKTKQPSNLLLSLVRDEYPDHPLVLKGTKSGGSTQQYQPVVMLEKTYTIHWNGRAPREVYIYPVNFNSGEWLRLGLCYPRGTTFRVKYQLERRVPHAVTHEEDIHSVSGLNAVQGGNGKMFYFEESTGLFFLKVRAHYDREGHNYCSHMGCERIFISATMTSDAVSDCTAAAYPKYILPPTETVPMPNFLSLVNDCSGCGAPEPIVSVDDMKFLEVTIQAAGWQETQQGHRAYIEIDGVRFGDSYRGFRVISVDALTGAVLQEMTFDTHGQTEADLAMANFIRNDISPDSIVLVATRDEPSRYAAECLVALKEIGAQEPVETGNRGNFAMVGFKGTVWPTWIQQVNLPSGQGPAQIYARIPLMA